MNVEYSSLLQQYHQTQEDLRLSKQDMNQFRQDKERDIKILKQKLTLYQEGPEMIEKWNSEHALLSSDIIKKLHTLACHAQSATNLQWKDLQEVAEQELPDFISQIHQKKCILTYQEYILCILIRLQFSQGEQAALLGVSKQRINNLKRSLNFKLFQESSAKTLNSNIFGL